MNCLFFVRAFRLHAWMARNLNRSLMRPLMVGIVFLATSWRLQAQPTIVSVSPTDGATNVSSTTQVVFTFSEAMYTAATTATFSNLTANTFVFVTPSWNGAGTVLTCTPTSSFGSDSLISWNVFGVSASFQPLSGTTAGTFTTGSGGGSGGGSGTNKITSFVVGKIYEYDQTSTAAPTLDP